MTFTSSLTWNNIIKPKKQTALYLKSSIHNGATLKQCTVKLMRSAIDFVYFMARLWDCAALETKIYRFSFACFSKWHFCNNKFDFTARIKTVKWNATRLIIKFDCLMFTTFSLVINRCILLELGLIYSSASHYLQRHQSGWLNATTNIFAVVVYLFRKLIPWRFQHDRATLFCLIFSF